MTEKKQKVQLPPSPFPGIDPFNYAERNVFFAREQESQALIRLVVIHRGVLLYADSGTGKSSLINAGLLPDAIAEGLQPERLRVQPRQDEEIIVERLSKSASTGPPFLPSIFSSDEEEERVVLPVASFLETIKKKAQSVRPLLIFDQFEEWFTLFEEGAKGKRAEEALTAQHNIRDAILSLLRYTELPVKILLVLREDYLAKLTPFFKRYANLPDQYLRLTPLKGPEIKRIIRGPFEDNPGHYDPEIPAALAQKIRKEFEGRSGGEPVRLSEVQIVCRTLYESGKAGNELEAYFDQHGGVQGILEEYLRQALESLPKNQRDPAVGLLSRMITAAGTRNVISGEDVISRVENEDNISRNILSKTLDSLEQESKLVRRERRREVYYYEISSEFLVGWIRTKARERAERLRIAEKERELLEEKERAEKQAKITARLRQQRRGLVLASLLAIIAAAAAVVFLIRANDSAKVATRERDKATQQEARADSEAKLAREARDRAEKEKAKAESERDRAEKEKAKAERAQDKAVVARKAARDSARVARNQRNIAIREREKTVSLVLATQALDVADDSTLAAWLAYKAYEFSKVDTSEKGAGHFPAQVYEALQQTRNALVPDNKRNPEVVSTADWIRSVAFSRNTKEIATGGANDSLRVIDFRSKKLSKIHYKHQAPVRAVVFSQDGQYIASGAENGTVFLWKPKSDTLSTNVGHPVWSLAFSPDGGELVIAGADSGILFYDLNLTVIRTLKTETVGTRSLAFSPDGKLLAACNLDGNVRIWHVNSLALLWDFKSQKEFKTKNFRTIAFHPKGNILLVGDENGFLYLSRLAPGGDKFKPIRSWRGHKMRVNSVVFNPVRPWLASGSADGTVKLWHLEDLFSEKMPKPIVLKGHDSWIWSLAFSPDGNLLVSSGSDGTARIWQADPSILAGDIKLNPLYKAQPDSVLQDYMGEDYLDLIERLKKNKQLSQK